MKINCKYMKGDEFKARQFWLPFSDAVGLALQVMAEVKEKTADWFKAWVKSFKSPRTVKKQEQLNFNFRRSITEWANWTPEKNLQIFD